MATQLNTSLFVRGVLFAALASLLLTGVGCGTGGAKYKNMPADHAWASMQYDDSQDVEVAKWMRIFTGNNNFTETIEQQSTRTREALASDTALSTEAVDGLADEMAQKLVQPLLAYSADKPYRLVIAVGRFNDRSPEPNQYVTTVLDRVFTRLEQNSQITNNYRLIRSTRSDANAVLEEIGIDPNTRSPRAGGSLVQGVNPEALLLLTGDYLQQPSAKQNEHGLDKTRTQPVPVTTYTIECVMSYRIEKVTTREAVLNTSDEVRKLMKWHPYHKRWMNQADDDAAAQAYRNELAAKAASKTK